MIFIRVSSILRLSVSDVTLMVSIQCSLLYKTTYLSRKNMTLNWRGMVLKWKDIYIGNSC